MVIVCYLMTFQNHRETWSVYYNYRLGPSDEFSLMYQMPKTFSIGGVTYGSSNHNHLLDAKGFITS